MVIHRFDEDGMLVSETTCDVCGSSRQVIFEEVRSMDLCLSCLYDSIEEDD